MSIVLPGKQTLACLRHAASSGRQLQLQTLGATSIVSSVEGIPLNLYRWRFGVALILVVFLITMSL